MCALKMFVKRSERSWKFIVANLKGWTILAKKKVEKISNVIDFGLHLRCLIKCLREELRCLKICLSLTLLTLVTW